MTSTFAVHAARPQGPVRVLSETGFEAAVMAFVEDYALPADHEGDVVVIVREVETGREHCFRIDLASGDTSPCGQTA